MQFIENTNLPIATVFQLSSIRRLNQHWLIINQLGTKKEISLKHELKYTMFLSNLLTPFAK